MAGTTEPLAEKPKTFDTVGNLPAMPKLNEGASKLTGASKAEFEKALGVYQPFLTAQEGMVKGLGRAESDILQSEQEQKRIQATGTSAAAQKQVADIEKGQRDLDEAMQKEPIPKFVPTKETADDLVVLFSLVNVMGFLIGGAGKENSQAAMSAMNGMLEGHQKGRADLYKQELSEFDKNFKAMVQKHAEFRKRYEDAVKLAAVDKEAGVAQAELVATEYGSEVVKAKAKKGDILGGLEILNSGLNAVKEAQKRVEKIEDEANKRQYELDKEKDRRRFELDMQKASFAHAEKIDAEKQPSQFWTDVNTGTVYQYDVNKRSWIPATGLPAGVVKAGAGGAKPDAGGGQDVALVQTYGFPRNEVARLNKDTLPTTVAIVYSAEQTKKLANDVKNNPDAAGLALSFLKNIDKYLPARYDTTDADSGVSYLQSQADKEITGSNQTTVSKARMIAKDVVDVINARALAASGGKRGTVFELRMQKDVLGLENMSAQSAVDVFNGLAEKDLNSLKRYGFSPETLTGVKSRVLGSSKAEAETGRDEKGSFHYEYNEDKTKRRKVYD